jgi:hypothetical protein
LLGRVQIGGASVSGHLADVGAQGPAQDRDQGGDGRRLAAGADLMTSLWPGTNVMILKIFRPKNGEMIVGFDSKHCQFYGNNLTLAF